MIHNLKILPGYFVKVVDGSKKFELRKDDRGYKVGDTLLLREFDGEKREYTGREIRKEVTYILKGGMYGLQKGYVIMSLGNIQEEQDKNFNPGEDIII